MICTLPLESCLGDVIVKKRVKIQLPIKDIFGETVQSARYKKGYKAEDVATLLDCSPHHYSDIENNRTKPSYPRMISLLRILDIDANEIVYPERAHLDKERLQLIHAIETCTDEQFKALHAFFRYLEESDKA